MRTNIAKGYLAASLFLHEKHELLLLMIQSIKKDLESDNALEICAALTTICKLMSADYIPAVLPKIVDLVGHPKYASRSMLVVQGSLALGIWSARRR